jgi:hypothetical protein
MLDEPRIITDATDIHGFISALIRRIRENPWFEYLYLKSQILDFKFSMIFPP